MWLASGELRSAVRDLASREDFDLVYAYPWPDETEWMHALFRRHAGPNAALMSYSVRDGFELTGRAE